MLLTVGVDVARGRIVVKEVHKVNGSDPAHFAVMYKAIEMAAHCYCIKERTRLGIYRKECNHPKYRIKKRHYVVDERVLTSGKIETTYAHARFCTRCGAKMEES